MTQPTADLLVAFYDAVRRGDVPTARDLLADDVVFHQPGRNPTSGDHVGIDAVFGLLAMLRERSGGTFRFEVHDLVASDDHAVGLITIAGER